MGERITATAARCVTVNARTAWWHIELTTSDGLTGIGEASINPVPADLEPQLTAAAKSLIGQEVGANTLASVAPLLAQGFVQRSIHAALDQAIWDLRAQAAGVPLYRLLVHDGPAATIPLYANINRATRDRSPKGFASNAARAVADGQCCLKIAPFDDLSPKLCHTEEGDRLIGAALNRIRAVAESGAELRVDCHWRLTPQAALGLIPALAEIGVTWFECPLPEAPEAIADLQAIRAAANRVGIRTAGLETFGGWPDVQPFVEGGAYDVVMPDVKHAGRLTDILEIAQRAAAAGVAVSLHNPSGPVSHAVSLHVALAAGGPERTEFQWDESPLFFGSVTPAPQFAGDQGIPGDSPGIGTRLNGPGLPA